MPSPYLSKIISGISKGMFQDHTKEISHNELWIYNYNRHSKLFLSKSAYKENLGYIVLFSSK